MHQYGRIVTHYTPQQLEALREKFMAKNPAAPHYQPRIWKDGDFKKFQERMRYFPEIHHTIVRLEGQFTFNVLAKILHSQFHDVATVSDIPLHRLEDCRKAMRDIFNTVTFSTNCYDYAANCARVSAGLTGVAGAASGHPYKHDSGATLDASVKSAIEAVQRDGATLFDPLEEVPVDRYLCLMFSMRIDERVKDFHFARQDYEGVSHKRGPNYPTNHDFNKQPITDPLQASWGKYTHLEAVFLMPRGGMKTSPGYAPGF